MKVYVVLAPDWIDDKAIEVLDEVFSSKEKAEAYVNSQRYSHEYVIVEKEVF